MSIILDSSFIFAWIDQRDKNHARAIELLIDIQQLKYGSIAITDYIFDEVTTLVMVKQTVEKAIEIGGKLKSTNVILYKISDEVFENAWKLFQQKRKISFTDCTIVEEMKEKSIKCLATFDSGFEQFKEIHLVK